MVLRGFRLGANRHWTEQGGVKTASALADTRIGAEIASVQQTTRMSGTASVTGDDGHELGVWTVRAEP